MKEFLLENQTLLIVCTIIFIAVILLSKYIEHHSPENKLRRHFEDWTNNQGLQREITMDEISNFFHDATMCHPYALKRYYKHKYETCHSAKKRKKFLQAAMIFHQYLKYTMGDNYKDYTLPL